MMAWFWLSFVNSSHPKGDSFLGAVVVEASNYESAIKRAWQLNINPGGQVRSAKFPEGRQPKPEICNRLLKKDQATKIAEWSLEQLTDPV